MNLEALDGFIEKFHYYKNKTLANYKTKCKLL